MKELEKRMEELKKQLNEMIYEIDRCNEKNILEVSQELDEIIFQYMTKKFL